MAVAGVTELLRSRGYMALQEYRRISCTTPAVATLTAAVTATAALSVAALSMAAALSVAVAGGGCGGCEDGGGGGGGAAAAAAAAEYCPRPPRGQRRRRWRLLVCRRRCSRGATWHSETARTAMPCLRWYRLPRLWLCRPTHGHQSRPCARTQPHTHSLPSSPPHHCAATLSHSLWLPARRQVVCGERGGDLGGVWDYALRRDGDGDGGDTKGRRRRRRRRRRWVGGDGGGVKKCSSGDCGTATATATTAAAAIDGDAWWRATATATGGCRRGRHDESNDRSWQQRRPRRLRLR